MKFARKAVASALVQVFGIGSAVALFGAPALAQDIKVEVTGTNIRRVDVETVSQVEVITREEITRTGMPTVAEVLRNLPANNGGSYGESFTNSFAPGAAGISLRGLGQKTTLVLLNGRRVSGYGFAQNISDSFVDLNAIPSSAVERVEILKDGASAIYGSDAIAGVVNIILRRDFQGVEAAAAIGDYEGINDYNATLTAGYGNLAKDKFNVFGVLDYYKRDHLRLSDTKFGETRDYRNVAGGRNLASLTTGGTWRQLTPTGGLSNTYKAIDGCEAAGNRVMTGPQAAAAGLINLTPPTPGVPGGQSATTFATNVATAAATNTFCTRDFNDGLTAIPETERVGFIGRGTYEFSPTVSAYAEVGISHNTSFQIFTAPFFAGTTGLSKTAAGLQPFTYNVNFAPGVAGNPFASNARYVGSLWDTGTRDAEITSDTTRLLAGAKYVLGGWDLDSAVGFSKNKVEQTSLNRLSLSGVSGVFGVPTSLQPPVPVSTTSLYNLNTPAVNSPAARNQIRIDVSRESTSELFFVDTKGSREIEQWKLPGGAVAVAVGGEFRSEKLNDNPDPRAQNGEVLGQGVTATDGSRESYAVFAEFALPLTKQLEAQIAGRYDHYSDYGSSTTPKVGVKWNPMKELLFRANWGKGFRAPTLPEISKSVATSFQIVIDPEDDVQRQISGVSLGNPNLKAEKSTSATLGVVFEPSRNFNISIDGYWIDWRDVVERPSSQDVIDASCPNGGPGCPSTPTVIRDPANNNQVVTVFRQYTNLSSRKTRGVDVDMRLRMPTESSGLFTARVFGTYVDSFKEEGVEYAGSNAGSNTIPRVKGVFALDWDYGPWALTGRANYTHGFSQDLLPASFRAVQNPEFQNGTYPSRVGSYTTWDAYGRYVFNKSWSISGSVLNVFDKTPPFDPGFTTTELYDWSVYDVRGRQFRLAFTYKL